MALRIIDIGYIFLGRGKFENLVGNFKSKTISFAHRFIDLNFSSVEKRFTESKIEDSRVEVKVNFFKIHTLYEMTHPVERNAKRKRENKQGNSRI